MTSDKLLNQEEIDLLMGNQMAGGASAEQVTQPNDVLSDDEKDALGEIGNISMGSASTTLSELLSQKVNITSPRVWISNKKDLLASFNIPYLVIKVEFVEGLSGFNVLVMKVRDALVIANLMMGGDGNPQQTELSEMEISAASEAMNMMIGTASTSLAQMFQKPVNISPPVSALLNDLADTEQNDVLSNHADDDNLVIVSFHMTIGDLVDTEIMQVLSVDTAKEEADLLLSSLNDTEYEEPAPAETISEDVMSDDEISQLINSLAESDNQPAPMKETAPVKPPPTQPVKTAQNSQMSASPPPRNLDLILDIPLQVSVVLGRTKQPIRDVLAIGPGSVVELQSLADEPVEILVNGTLVAEGEVVVVNENFGVKITNIISPEERIKRLAK
ncbi:flagellar motor switch phosphatase FliY [Peptococcaceae bacterium 1198_IL3148]